MTGSAAPSSRSVPPGPPPRKGGLVETLRYGYRFMIDPVGFVHERFERYGDIYYAPSKDGGLYVLRHPDHLAQVLMTRARCYRKQHTAFARMSEVLGQGLLNTDGDVWKRHRRMLQPAFHKKRLAAYATVMTSEAERTLGRWRAGDERDIGRDMMELTLRIVSRCLFHHDVGDDTDRVAAAMRAFNDHFSSLDVLPRWIPSPARSRAKRALAELDAIVYDLIDARRAAMERGAPAPDDMLQSLVTAVDDEGDGAGLSRVEVRDQLVTFFLAGHETTSHALTWTWYLLSRNRAAGRRLREELHDVLGDRVPTVDDLPALRYTEQALLESMRLYPPAYVLARRAHVDTQIGDYEVPAGSEVVIWTYHTHRDRRWYPDPEAYRPERFEPDAVAERPKLAYLPFGAGPRACIGQQFSLLESKLVLATLARRFEPRCVGTRPIEGRYRVTLAPRGGMPMRLHAVG